MSSCFANLALHSNLLQCHLSGWIAESNLRSDSPKDARLVLEVITSFEFRLDSLDP